MNLVVRITPPADSAEDFLLLLLILLLIEESKSKITSKSKTESWFMVPMQAGKRKRAFPELARARFCNISAARGV